MGFQELERCVDLSVWVVEKLNGSEDDDTPSAVVDRILRERRKRGEKV
jgi:hypothetical protein